MQLFLKNLSGGALKFCKQHRGRMKGVSHEDNGICFGKYALRAVEPGWITSRQIEAARRAMTRNVSRGGKVWVRVFPDKIVTEKALGVRMGQGRGSPAYCVSVIKPGRILYELGGVSEAVAREAVSIASSKLPIQIKFTVVG